VELEWAPFSLEVVNLEEGKDPRAIQAFSGPPLRTAVLLADAVGADAVGSFYGALGQRMFDAPPPPDDGETWARGALAAAGLSPELCDKALADASTWDRVVDETMRVVERVGRLGVPTLMFDPPDGPAVFGPVISEPPADDEAVELWRHTTWLVRNANFAEFKRKRSSLPDLAMIRWRRDRQATTRSGG
jgi:hypothetical protein